MGACALPSVSTMGAGNALVLNRPARAGVAGVVVDLLRAAVGTRVLPALVWSWFVMVPPLPTLLGRLVLVIRSWNPEAYCSTTVRCPCDSCGADGVLLPCLAACSLPPSTHPSTQPTTRTPPHPLCVKLLSHPLTRERQAAMASALELASTPLGVADPLAALLLPAEDLVQGGQQAACRRMHADGWLGSALRRPTCSRPPSHRPCMQVVRRPTPCAAPRSPTCTSQWGCCCPWRCPSTAGRHPLPPPPPSQAAAGCAASRSARRRLRTASCALRRA